MKDKQKKGTLSSLTGLVIRFLVISIILEITAFLAPGFVIVGLWSIILAAVVISFIDYLVEKLMRVDASPLGRGIKGFVLAAIILYITQYVVLGMGVTIIGAIIASILIGILDAILPGRAM